MLLPCFAFMAKAYRLYENVLECKVSHLKRRPKALNYFKTVAESVNSW